MTKTELLACKQCGKERLVQRSYMLRPWFTNLCRDCSRKSRAGENNPMWKDGRYRTMQGYIDIRLYPDDPYYTMTSKRWHYCREHRYIMAQSLGRCLTSKEGVHHKNGIKDDNRLENLELMVKTQNRGEVTCPHCRRTFWVM